VGKSQLEIRQFNNIKQDGRIIELDEVITAITVSKQGTYLLVN